MRKNEKVTSQKSFSAKLLKWDKEKNFRQMPWKGEKNPYRIWLSEIILQQTRVEQGLDYYNRFIEAFPDVHRLAAATDRQVFKLWEGLGYYSRCRNLIATARYISGERKGIFPGTYEEIKELKGIGPYTAAAISSFAFNLPYAVIDGNVYRVIARMFGINTPVDSAKGKRQFAALAGELLDKKQPGRYNQAIMDFGATICKPAAPLCRECVFRKTCYAYLNDMTDKLPVKEKKIKIKTRWFYFFVIEFNNKIAIRQRTAKDIWQHLYEFPLIESAKEVATVKIIRQAEKTMGLTGLVPAEITISPAYKQQLSHQLIKGKFITAKIKKTAGTPRDWEWVHPRNLKDYAFPRFINTYLQGLD